MKLTVKGFAELTVTELYEILRLRVDVFVVEQQCPYPEIDGKDPSAVHLFLQDGAGIHAYLRLLPPGVSFDTGLGRQIVAAGIQEAKRRGMDALTIEAQTYARGLYEQAGFRQISEEFLEDGIPHIRMRLAPLPDRME